MKLNNKGFSLVEVLLAVAITTIVFGSITALMVFATNSMKVTNERVAIQNDVKDAMNHIESYCLEAEQAKWQEVSTTSGGKADVLMLFEKRRDMKTVAASDGAIKIDDVENLTSNVYCYWVMEDGKSLYFGKCSKIGNNVKLNALPTGNEYLLSDNLDTDGFKCKVRKVEESGKYAIDIQIKEKLNNTEYETSKTVYLRNQ